MQELEIGDIVVHPQHGPAAVRGFADRKVADRKVEYVDLETLANGMRIKVPVDRLDSVGVRMPLTVTELDAVLDVLREESAPYDNRWMERMKTGEALLATGHLKDTAAVARDLWRRQEESHISAAERGLKTRAVQRVSLELAAVHGTTAEAALDLVESAIFAGQPKHETALAAGS